MEWNSSEMVINPHAEYIEYCRDNNQSVSLDAKQVIFKAAVCANFVNEYLESMIENA